MNKASVVKSSWKGNLLSCGSNAKTVKGDGLNIAVVFRRKADIPAEYLGLPTIDGDRDDMRFLDPKGVVVALYAKGKAKHDTSGFVVN